MRILEAVDPQVARPESRKPWARLETALQQIGEPLALDVHPNLCEQGVSYERPISDTTRTSLRCTCLR